MATMQVSVLRKAGDIGVEEREVPTPGRGEVLVEIGSVGVCGSDVHYYEHGRIGRFVVDAPLVLGHEAGGVVVEVGPEVRHAATGPAGLDRARRALPPAAGSACPAATTCAPTCGSSPPRRTTAPSASTSSCPPSCVRRARPISDDAAGLLEPLSVGIWACRRAASRPAAGVLVTGAGPIGIIAAQVARAYGADRVTVTDVNPHRLALAAQLGLEAIDVSATPIAEAGLEPDVLIECSGNPRATWDAFSTVARAGRVVLVGMGGDELRAVPPAPAGPGDHPHRRVPLRQHLADRDPAGRVGPRRPRRGRHRPLRPRLRRSGAHRGPRRPERRQGHRAARPLSRS